MPYLRPGMNKKTPEELSRTTEALLFAWGRPASREELAKTLGADAAHTEQALVLLQTRLNGGIVLMDDGRMVELRTNPAEAASIEAMQKEELARDIGKAGLEVAAAVLYRGPLTRRDIDFIRGVNSSQSLRTLMMRGLVRRVDNRGSFLYEPTTELLAHLGIASRAQLPEFDATLAKLKAAEDAYRAGGLSAEEA